MLIEKNQTIQEIITKHPEVVEHLLEKGFHCIGCGASEFETLEQGAIVHGMDPEELLKELNNTLIKKDLKENKTTIGDYKIEHDIPGCIGCSACAALNPENWEMKEVDGKMKAIPKKEQLTKEEFEANNEAAEVCPVNVIHIIKNKTNKKVI